jgi:PTS system mannose-specific IIB component
MDSSRDQRSIWVRVDDRLIHGQVTVGWRQYLRYADIWVVDDQAGGDPYLQDALRLAVPDGVGLRVYTVREALALEWPPPEPSPMHTTAEGPTWRLPGGQGGLVGGRVLVLLRSPEIALALVEGGVPMTRLNVGNLSSRPGSVRAFKNISLTPAHVEALDALAQRGVCITFQLVPEGAQADWSSVRRRVLT